MKNPTPLLELCEKATKGPWTVEPHPADRTVLIYGPQPTCRLVAELSPQTRLGQIEIDANAQLIARMNPTVVKAVYEALRWACNASPNQSWLRLEARRALALLDGTTAPSDLT